MPFTIPNSSLFCIVLTLVFGTYLTGILNLAAPGLTTTDGMAARVFGPLITQPAAGRHSATLIMLHGLGDTGEVRQPRRGGWGVKGRPDPDDHMEGDQAALRVSREDLPCIFNVSLLPCTSMSAASVPSTPTACRPGNGWAPVGPQLNLPHIKMVFPTAPTRPISINMGMSMPGKMPWRGGGGGGIPHWAGNASKGWVA